MEASREFDRLIAEKVMGDVLAADNWWSSPDGAQFSHEDCGPRFYSSDWNETGRLIALMRQHGHYLQCNDTLSAYRARFFTVANTVEWDRQSADGAYYEFAETLPHAVCLAALRVLGIEV